VSHLQVAVALIIIADHGQAVSPNRDRCEIADSPGAVKSGGAGAGASGVAAVGHFQVAVGLIAITDHGQAVNPNRD